MPRRNPAPAAEFGRLLLHYAKERRADASLRDIAQEVGCGSALLTRMSQGQRRPPARYIAALADSLRISGKDREAFIKCGLRAYLGDDFETVRTLFK